MLESLYTHDNAFMGTLLHAIGGLAAASFYIPYKKIKYWSWEIYWMVGGFFSWIIAPWLLAMILLPQTPAILINTPLSDIFLTLLFGLLWGVGGLTFGLTMRYLGIALGYALALGISAVIGTLVPPLFSGELANIALSSSGQVMLLGVAVCVMGIGLSGKAGTSKQNELSDNDKKTAISEFNFVKGVSLALFSGVMSAFMAYAFTAGKPIAQLAVSLGAPSIWQNLPVLIVILLGGFITNFIWCAYLATKNKSWSQLTLSTYTTPNPVVAGQPTLTLSNPRFINVAFCALAGLTWYMQFFFYGMGTTMMGAYEFSSWTLHMASIIIFSTFWGLALNEWQGASMHTKIWNYAGLGVLILSMIIIGWGNTLADSGTAH